MGLELTLTLAIVNVCCTILLGDIQCIQHQQQSIKGRLVLLLLVLPFLPQECRHLDANQTLEEAVVVSSKRKTKGKDKQATTIMVPPPPQAP